MPGGVDKERSSGLRRRLAWWLAAAGAVACWAGLAIDLTVLIQAFAVKGLGKGAALWRFLGFFTVLSNLLVAVLLGRAALLPDRPPLPRLCLAALVAIVMTGLVYAALLAGLRTPTGWDRLADNILHRLMPILFLGFWLAGPHGRLGWGDGLRALVFPILYCAYALVRGAVEGWYPYPFLDAGRLPLGALAANIAMLSIVFAALAMGLVALDRAIGRRRGVSG